VADAKRPTIHGRWDTWATLALRDGVAPTLVSSRLRHRNVSITVDVYSHAVPDWATFGNTDSRVPRRTERSQRLR